MTDSIRRVCAALAALGAAIVVLALAGAPATATEQAEPVCPTFKLRGATGIYPEITFGATPPGSQVVDHDTVMLVKPTEGVKPGVEFATYAAGLEFDAPTTIRVDYQLSDGASTVSGAVRLFYYEAADADTINDAPTDKAIAEGSSGTLTITGVTKIGTLGVTYDGSNDAAGKVTFTNLRAGTTPVHFQDTCIEASPTPTATVGSPTATNPPPTASGPPAEPGELPVTGVNVWMLAAGGLVLVGGGALAIVAVRRQGEDSL